MGRQTGNHLLARTHSVDEAGPPGQTSLSKHEHEMRPACRVPPLTFPVPVAISTSVPLVRPLVSASAMMRLKTLSG
eukprot:37776-Eustigmatos_ZCMA.PRE.1